MNDIFMIKPSVKTTYEYSYNIPLDTRTGGESLAVEASFNPGSHRLILNMGKTKDVSASLTLSLSTRELVDLSNILKEIQGYVQQHTGS